MIFVCMTNQRRGLIEEVSLYHRFLGVSATLKVTTNVKMIEVFMLVGLILTFVDVLLQCYLKYHGFIESKGRLSPHLYCCKLRIFNVLRMGVPPSY